MAFNIKTEKNGIVLYYSGKNPNYDSNDPTFVDPLMWVHEDFATSENKHSFATNSAAQTFVTDEMNPTSATITIVEV